MAIAAGLDGHRRPAVKPPTTTKVRFLVGSMILSFSMISTPSMVSTVAMVSMVSIVSMASIVSLPSTLSAQDSSIVRKFDRDKNGRLDRNERKKARAYLVDDSEAKRLRGLLKLLTRGKRIAKPKVGGHNGPKLSQDSAKKFPGRGLYDPSIVRTLFLDFEHKDWFEELMEFYKMKVDVPATLVVDGKKYEGVGVRCRGGSSFLMTAHSLKKSFNISIDHTNPKLRLYGAKTLNLLNGFDDPSLLREALFSHIARHYVPAPRVNFVKVVINGEYWGLYVNAQQFNKDFVRDWFGTGGGTRWRVLRGTQGSSALRYLGENKARYSGYEIRSRRDENAKKRLIRLCRILDTTDPADLPAELPKVLAVDEALWFCALESVFLAGDGYLKQGYDYRLYEDKAGRFHVVPHDKNEILGSGTNNSAAANITTSPLHGADNPFLPLFHRMLAVPEWRQRYLAHVRVLATRWLNWNVVGPVCQTFHDSIREDVLSDVNKLFSTELFERSLKDPPFYESSLKSQIIQRHRYLLAHDLLKGPWPKISGVQASFVARAPRRLRVTATISGDAQVSKVLVYFRSSRRGPYDQVAMHDDGKHGDGEAGDGVFGGVTKAVREEGKVWFYLEARAGSGTTFFPEEAAVKPMVRR